MVIRIGVWIDRETPAMVALSASVDESSCPLIGGGLPAELCREEPTK